MVFKIFKYELIVCYFKLICALCLESTQYKSNLIIPAEIDEFTSCIVLEMVHY
jgi:hypothetical protein